MNSLNQPDNLIWFVLASSFCFLYWERILLEIWMSGVSPSLFLQLVWLVWQENQRSSCWDPSPWTSKESSGNRWRCLILFDEIRVPVHARFSKSYPQVQKGVYEVHLINSVKILMLKYFKAKGSLKKSIYFSILSKTPPPHSPSMEKNKNNMV